MNKKALIAFIVVAIAAVTGYFIWRQTSLPVVPAQEVTDIVKHADDNTALDTNQAMATNPVTGSPQLSRMVPQEKTYTNHKLGFSFPYPANWFQNGKEEEAVNLSGAPTVVTVNFSDSLSPTTLSVEYHLAPKGAELYRYAVSQLAAMQGWYATGGKQTEVAGHKAIEANTILDKDGRGKPLNPPVRLIVVDFLDKQQTGGIEIQFRTPVPEEAEVAKFRQLLSAFKFTD